MKFATKVNFFWISIENNAEIIELQVFQIRYIAALVTNQMKSFRLFESIFRFLQNNSFNWFSVVSRMTKNERRSSKKLTWFAITVSIEISKKLLVHIRTVLRQSYSSGDANSKPRMENNLHKFFRRQRRDENEIIARLSVLNIPCSIFFFSFAHWKNEVKTKQRRK